MTKALGELRLRNIIPHQFKPGEEHWNWSGGFYIDKRGYRLVRCPGHPRAEKGVYVREHVLVMEAHLSQLLGFKTFIDEALDIHHINGDRLDNRIENLLLVSDKQHGEISGRETRLKRYHPPVCIHCGSDNTRRKGFSKDRQRRCFFCLACRHQFISAHNIF